MNMNAKAVNRKLESEHGIVCSFPHEFFGYFGWPSITRMDDGTLVVAASGLRNAHICPFGRSVICTSVDDGKTWTSPTVVNDFPLDDRDTGILSLGGRCLLISWFSTDTRKSKVGTTYTQNEDSAWVARYESGFRRMTDDRVARWLGSWVRTSSDKGETWNPPVKVEITAPHGPIRLRTGALLYLGKEFVTNTKRVTTGTGYLTAMRSKDMGASWERLGSVPLYKGSTEENYHEPHVVELSDGTLLGLIRFQYKRETNNLEDAGLETFSLMQTTSSDGGNTWTRTEPLGFHGAPPHLLHHSSGKVVGVYGYRKAPYGERAMITPDGGQSWCYHYIIRDDGLDSDLGYPASVELADGSIFTIYYQKVVSVEEKCSILWSRWSLPAAALVIGGCYLSARL